MLSRDQFQLGCHTFTSLHPQWSWIPGDRPGYGFLTRTRYLQWKSPLDPHSYVNSTDLEEVEEWEEEEDIATAQASELPSLSVHEYIVFSASFSVPAFYFTMQDSSVCSDSVLKSIWIFFINRRESLVSARNNADIVV